MLDINGWEIIVLMVVAIVVLGPERLPGYAARLAGWVRQIRVLAEGAKSQLKDQMGPDFQDVNWRQYDLRQYDPRRIVREALAEPLEAPAAQPGPPAAPGGSGSSSGGAQPAAPASGSAAAGDAASLTRPAGTPPWDPDAT